MNDDSVAHATTALFVPGDRPERFSTAVRSGADLVIIDLEDAVARNSKADARENAIRALRDGAGGFGAAVRVNTVSEGGLDDAKALAPVSAANGGGLRAVMLPKAENEDDIVALNATFGSDVPLIPLIESAKGLRRVSQLAIGPGVVRLAFGALDFGVDAGASSLTILDYARCEIVLSSRSAGIAAPIDSPNPKFRDLDAVGKEARRSSALGFGGQLCIHPAQVPVVSAAFRPTDDEVAWAQKILSTNAEGVTQLDGTMVDRPVLLQAQMILSRR